MSDDHLDLIKLGHALEGQTISEEALDRARRVLYAETTHEEAHQELEQKYEHLRRISDMAYRNDVEDAVYTALTQFGLGPYVDEVMDSLDIVIDWDESDDPDVDESGSVVWFL